MKVWPSTLLSLLLIGSANAQTAVPSSTGVLTGSAYDVHHRPIAAAKIIIQDGGKDRLTVETDAKGTYRASVPSGVYTVRASSKNGAEASAGPLHISASSVTAADLVLQPTAAAQPQFFDEPNFVVAGVTDNTYRGGHGSDTVLRSAETLTKATTSLNRSSQETSTADPHHAQGEIAERSGHPLEAVAEFQRAAEANGSESNIFDWGSELLAHRAPQPAAAVFTKGTRLYPQSVRMLLGLATALYSAGSYAQAASVFFQASDLDPHNPEPYLFLSQVKSREITQLPGFQERLARFARLQPGNALASYQYAVCIWEQRKGPEDATASDKAASLLNAALAIDPDLAVAHLQFGIIEAARGNYAAAIRSYRKAINTSPGLEEAHYRLSEAYRMTGDRTSAAEELALYNELSKESQKSIERERQQIVQFVVALRSK